MALTNGEVQRIKHELGYNQLTVGAEPFIGVTQLFSQIVQPYLEAGALTTSSTTVAAAGTPTPVALTLGTATGFSVNDRVVVDVDGAQEAAVVESISGSAVTVLLSRAHVGTYTVTVEGGETIVRGILAQIQGISGIGSNAGRLQAAASSAGVKRVNEIEFFGGGQQGATRIQQLAELLAYWRNELAVALNVANLRALNGSSGSACAMY